MPSPAETFRRKPARVAFDGTPRDSGEPAPSLARTVAILVCLLRSGSVDLPWYQRNFQMSERAFLRDLQYLRTIGDELGIRISRQIEGRVRLESVAGSNPLRDEASSFEDALRAVARALGAPAARELGTQSEPATTTS